MSAHGSARVLLVCPRQEPFDTLARAAEVASYDVRPARDIDSACALLRTEDFAVVVACLDAPDRGALTLLRAAGRGWPAARVVFVFERLDASSPVLLPAIRGGAFGCLDGLAETDGLWDRVRAAVRDYEGQLSGPSDRAAAASRVSDTRDGDTRTLEWVRELSALAHRAAGADELFASTAQAAVDVARGRHAWVITWEGRREQVVSVRGAEDGDEVAPPLGFAREVGLAARPLVRASDTSGQSTYVGVPITGESGVTGAIVVHGETVHDRAGDGRLLQPLADQAAIGRRLLGLHERLDGWSDALLQSLMTALNVHDENTEHHSQRVADVAVELALEMGLSNRSAELTELRQGALLHDVGKLEVSVEILQKAGPLTDDEWKEMRRHPEHGYQIVKGIPSLANAAQMIRASHERWDGAGYPQGIARDEIPLGARIFILADAWDAMTSDRLYRAALPHSEALREVRVNAGTQFDPEVAQAFARLEKRWNLEKRTRESAA